MREHPRGAVRQQPRHDDLVLDDPAEADERRLRVVPHPLDPVGLRRDVHLRVELEDEVQPARIVRDERLDRVAGGRDRIVHARARLALRDPERFERAPLLLADRLDVHRREEHRRLRPGPRDDVLPRDIPRHPARRRVPGRAGRTTARQMHHRVHRQEIALPQSHRHHRPVGQDERQVGRGAAGQGADHRQMAPARDHPPVRVAQAPLDHVPVGRQHHGRLEPDPGDHLRLRHPGPDAGPERPLRHLPGARRRPGQEQERHQPQPHSHHVTSPRPTPRPPPRRSPTTRRTCGAASRTCARTGPRAAAASHRPRRPARTTPRGRPAATCRGG